MLEQEGWRDDKRVLDGNEEEGGEWVRGSDVANEGEGEGFRTDGNGVTGGIEQVTGDYDNHIVLKSKEGMGTDGGNGNGTDCRKKYALLDEKERRDLC